MILKLISEYSLLFTDMRHKSCQSKKFWSDVSDSASLSSSISTDEMKVFIDRLRMECYRNSTKRNYYNIWKIFNNFFLKLDKKPNNWTDRITLFVGYLIKKQ